MEPRSSIAVLAHELKQNLFSGARLALFLPVRALDFRASIGQYSALVIASLAFSLAGGMLREGFPGHVDFGALTVALAQVPLVLAACVLAARLFREPRLALAFAVLLVATDPLFEIADVAIRLAGEVDAIEPYAAAVNWAFIAWGFAIVARTQLVLTGWRGRASWLALGLFSVMLLSLIWLFPPTEFWVPVQEDTEAETPEASITQEEVIHRQGSLLEEQLAALLPERPGVEDLYFVGVAPYALQDTFYQELTTVKELIDERFDTAGRSVALVNNSATLKDRPIATVSNLRKTLARLGRTINTEEDIVLLHITTHGSSDLQLAFDLPPLELRQLTPTALARMLADSGIKWKIIVLSACFSGGFIEALKDPNTLILTAADSAHSSFGCDYDSEITWFSKALYDEALRRTFSFTEAFELARRSVTAREKAQGYEPSNPQMFVGEAVRGKLAGLEKRLSARPSSSKLPPVSAAVISGAAPAHSRRVSSVNPSDSRTVVVNGRQ